MATETLNRTQHIISLAKELLDDIELSRISIELLLLKAKRLARLTATSKIFRWLGFELMGYNKTDDVSLEYLEITGRWHNGEEEGYFDSLVVIDAKFRAMDNMLKESSTLPYEDIKQLMRVVGEISAIKNRVLAIIHDFVMRIYYEKAFSGVSENIFENYKAEVDSRIAEVAGHVLEKIPSIYERLTAGDREAISQALNSCRRVIDSFADAIYPPTQGTLELDGHILKLDPSHHQNRINAYISERITSKSRKKRLRETLKNLYDRVTTGVHRDVTAEEARSLFLQTYLFLGEVLTLRESEATHDGNIES